ncbi:sll1863 family stress response protein [Undibacterium umbellatum]|uniref:Uncharacterized protein n=1 Tax=Undibacterium umbellatum TaxID=2762300 RepID=A0ABR6ZHX7_9BURK|nr:hypothetical protein [Undibacterium umbellatum]MBC3911329.1 hypothetical protein [Undibacterium umbellatum]
MMAKREAYIASIKAQLDELNISMTVMEAKVAASKEAMKEQYAKEIQKLYVQSQQVRDKLDEIKSASENNWESMINTTEKVRDAFVNSCHYFKAQLKED